MLSINPCFSKYVIPSIQISSVRGFILLLLNFIRRGDEEQRRGFSIGVPELEKLAMDVSSEALNVGRSSVLVLGEKASG